MASPFPAYLTLPGNAAPASSVGQLAPMTFLENLEVSEEGDLVVTSVLDGRLWRLPFGRPFELITQIEGRAYSVAAAPDGGWLVFGTGVDGRVAVFRVLADGAASLFLEIPEAVFPNGVQRMPGGHYLLADSVTATIWDVDYGARNVSAWYRHPLLGPAPGIWSPALNGMKVFDDTLYMTNSSAATFFALPLQDGRPAGEPGVVAHGLSGDDFAFDVEGNAYITTHPADVVLKLTPSGVLTKIAGPGEGVRGCTACRFGRRPGDETGLYVVTDGGLFNPESGGLKPAQAIRLEIGIKGAPVDVL